MISPGHLLESLNIAVVVLDCEAVVRYFNPAAEALFEISAKQALGEPLDRFLPRAKAYRRVVKRVVRRMQTVTEREVRIDLSPTKTLFVDCSITPLPQLQGVVVELLNLHQYQRITHAEQLVAQNESVRLLLRGLAHEIRNPLGGLRGAAQLLEGELGDDSLHEYTGVIIREADRLHALLTRMLGPTTLPNVGKHNVHQVTEHVYALLRAQSGKEVSILKDYDPSIPEFHFDRELMVQALLNVTQNAVEAAGKDGTVILRTKTLGQAHIGAKRHRLVVCIDVVDNGPGVPEHLKEVIFYPMVTGREGGSGLGLSIAQSLISRQGGLIEFSRQADQTTFSLLLAAG